MIRQRERRELLRESSRKCRLLKVQIELTHRCNHRCAHCRLDSYDRKDEITVDDIRRLLPELASLGCFSINLTGGEFLTRPDIEEMLTLFFESDFIYTLQTNATLVNDRMLDLLDENKRKIRIVVVSLFAMDEGIHDSITGVEGSHGRTLNAMMRLKERGFTICVCAMLMEPNYGQADKIRRFCEAEGFFCQMSVLLVPQEGGGTKPFKLRLTDEHLTKLPVPWERVINVEAHFDPKIYMPNQQDVSWCPMGRSTCFIESTGEVYPCYAVERSAGNIRRERFGEIWKNSPVFKEIRDYRLQDFECSGCELLPECLPCPGLAYSEHGEIFSSPKEKCRIVKTFLKGGGNQ